MPMEFNPENTVTARASQPGVNLKPTDQPSEHLNPDITYHTALCLPPSPSVIQPPTD